MPLKLLKSDHAASQSAVAEHNDTPPFCVRTHMSHIYSYAILSSIAVGSLMVYDYSVVYTFSRVDAYRYC